MSSTINADTTNGIVITSDTSGEIKLQSAGADIATVNSSGITLATGKDLTLSSTALDASASGIYLGGTAAANLLDDYEEGTWTPTSVSITFSAATGTYTRIGDRVTVTAQISYPTTSDTNGAGFIGLPFTVASGSANYAGNIVVTNYGSDNLYPFVNINTNAVLVRNNGNGDWTNANLSAKFFSFYATYKIA